ncbi:dihydropteroate synthase [Myceligenerans pegani]|uniref:dihydropteroate synthase n=1 Tax=Myceligenerans pegani TaxID=2776917 RepID=A0ABR9MUU4_9MICO|nr:dihydropteroate synthase [Myceligenerans sp. TRM 65318]MBE1875157.1 dihydropteroate synthase [Myceligenerans sp. TRM 65318]MBE3017428.1 dihydropteroate synthase [Myceligenerans sp. TRM 65318]
MDARDAEVAGLPELSGTGRTLVMGVVNVTPDSFSDGGEWFEPDSAVAHGLELLGEGADILDVGGESTRPGAGRVPQDQELARVLPVIEALAARGAIVSVDTTRSAVAERAVAAGARIVNDVSGGLADPGMARAVAEMGVPYVAMHWRGHSDVMDSLEMYDDVVTDVRDELAARMDALVGAGVDAAQIVLDPGLGFAKAGALNWPLLAHLDALGELGRPVLIGASRKRFLGHLLARHASGGSRASLSGETRTPRSGAGEPVPPRARDDATAAVSALSAATGAWCVRVHAVRASADAVRVAAAWERASGKAAEAGGVPAREREPRAAVSARSGPRGDVGERTDKSVDSLTDDGTDAGGLAPTWQDSQTCDDHGGSPR